MIDEDPLEHEAIKKFRTYFQQKMCKDPKAILTWFKLGVHVYDEDGYRVLPVVLPIKV